MKSYNVGVGTSNTWLGSDVACCVHIVATTGRLNKSSSAAITRFTIAVFADRNISPISQLSVTLGNWCRYLITTTGSTKRFITTRIDCNIILYEGDLPCSRRTTHALRFEGLFVIPFGQEQPDEKTSLNWYRAVWCQH